jgi:hypothetical protein
MRFCDGLVFIVDPFNRQPLSMSAIVPEVELKARFVFIFLFFVSKKFVIIWI